MGRVHWISGEEDTTAGVPEHAHGLGLDACLLHPLEQSEPGAMQE